MPVPEVRSLVCVCVFFLLLLFISMRLIMSFISTEQHQPTALQQKTMIYAHPRGAVGGVSMQTATDLNASAHSFDSPETRLELAGAASSSMNTCVPSSFSLRVSGCAFVSRASPGEQIDRIARVGFETARKRRGQLCSVDKSNVLEVSGDRLWTSSM